MTICSAALAPSATAPLPPVSKSQLDTLQVALDYSGWLNTGEQINGVGYALTPGTVPPLIVSGSKIQSNMNASPSANAIPGSPQATQPNISQSLVTFNLSQGQASVQYTIAITAVTNMGRSKTDSLKLINNPTPGQGDGCCDTAWNCNKTVGGYPSYNPGQPPYGYPGVPPAPAQQQATLFNGESTEFASSFVKYTVSDMAPQGANVLDFWFNVVDQCVYQYISDGQSAFWINFTPIPTRPPQHTVATVAPDPFAGQFGDTWWDVTNNRLNMLTDQGGGNVWYVI